MGYVSLQEGRGENNPSYSFIFSHKKGLHNSIYN